MASVFLSYSYPDRDLAEAVVSALLAVGVRATTPETVAARDGDLRTAIARASAEADRVIVLWSSAAARSRWAKQGARDAIKAWAQDRLVLARADETELPLGLRDIAVIDLASDPQRGIDELVRQSATAGRSFAPAREELRPGAARPIFRGESRIGRILLGLIVAATLAFALISPHLRPPQYTSSPTPKVIPEPGSLVPGKPLLPLPEPLLPPKLSAPEPLPLLLPRLSAPEPLPLLPPKESISGSFPKIEVPRASGQEEVTGPSIFVMIAVSATLSLVVCVVMAKSVVVIWSTKGQRPWPGTPSSRQHSLALPPSLDTSALHEVFVSYSWQDKRLVDRLVEEIESTGRRVWIDRRAGTPRYAAPIVAAIRSTRLVALMCSHNAFASDHVVREVYVAGDFKKPFIAFELDDSKIPDDFLYFLSGFPRVRAEPLDPTTIRAEITRFLS